MSPPLAKGDLNAEKDHELAQQVLNLFKVLGRPQSPLKRYSLSPSIPLITKSAWLEDKDSNETSNSLERSNAPRATSSINSNAIKIFEFLLDSRYFKGTTLSFREGN